MAAFLFWRGSNGVGFKTDDGFVGFRVAEFFAGEPGDGGRVITEGVNVGAQLVGDGFLPLQFSVEPENFPAHAFVLMDERQVGHANQNQNRQHHEGDHRLRELAPDAKINFHAASLAVCGAEVNADFADNRRRAV